MAESWLVRGLVLIFAVAVDGVVLSAPDSEGVDNSKKMWGYMLHMTSNNWSERPYTDYPIDYHRDQSLRLKLHFDERTWNRIVDELVGIGANTLLVDVEDGMRYDSHPEIAVEGCWPKEKMRAEVRRLKDLGFTLIPKLNFSATHDTWLKDWQEKIGTPEYRKMCGELIDEVCDVFDHPKFFHIGTDEETAELKEQWGLKHCRSAEVWWTDVLAMIAAVERNGARVCMWESTAMSRTEEFFRRCPRSVVITPTYYNYERIADINSTHPTLLFIKRLAENGFDVLPGGSNWNCEENFRETVAWCERNVDRSHILGYLMLPWQVTVPAWHRAMQRAVNYLEDAMLQAGAKEPPEGKRQPFAAWVNRLSDGKLDRLIHPEDRRIIQQTEEVVYDFGNTTGKQLTIDCMSFSKKDETITVCYGDKLDGTRISDPVFLADFVLQPQALKDGYRIFKPGFVFPHGRYVAIRQTRQIHYTRLALVDPCLKGDEGASLRNPPMWMIAPTKESGGR